jgi:hypothetical protein
MCDRQGESMESALRLGLQLRVETGTRRSSATSADLQILETAGTLMSLAVN